MGRAAPAGRRPARAGGGAGPGDRVRPGLADRGGTAPRPGHQRGVPRPRRARLGPVRPAGPARRHRTPLPRGAGPGDRRVGGRVRGRRQRRSRRRGGPVTGVRRHRAAPGPVGAVDAARRSGWATTSCSPASPASSGASRWRGGSARTRSDLFATDGPGTWPAATAGCSPPSAPAPGAALLAGDPHRFIEDPGVYQQIRLACPEYDVVGLAVPGVPGIAHFGHTGAVAWAITNAMADYQDLYAERLRRDGRPGAGARPGRLAAGAPPRRDDRGGRGGPGRGRGGGDRSRSGDRRRAGRRERPSACATRPGSRGDLGFATLPELLRARTVADVDHALRHWVEPVNVVQAADTAGGLLHRVAGAVPVRHPEQRPAGGPRMGRRVRLAGLARADAPRRRWSAGR